ncbi:MAG: PhzF family phenazine biosynthesis protein [Alphaproteobacteria bacterium]
MRLERGADRLYATFIAPKLPSAMGAAPGPWTSQPLIGPRVHRHADGHSGRALRFRRAEIPVRAGAVAGGIVARLARHGALEAPLSEGPASEVYVLTVTGARGGRFMPACCPSVGVTEDPATGSAAAALARFLTEVQRPPDALQTWTIHQGADMGRPSVIRLSAEFAGGALARVEVGGAAVLQSEGRFF